MVSLRFYNKKKKLKAYTLLEMIVSLAIIGIIITMFFNVLIISLRVTYLSTARSFIREEISNVTNSIYTDFRNSDSVLACGQQSESSSCELVVDNKTIKWESCEQTKICRSELINNEYVITFRSANNLEVGTLRFEKGFGDNVNSTRNNVLVTIIASHSNENLNINNIVKQTSISTRNYEF